MPYEISGEVLSVLIDPINNVWRDFTVHGERLDERTMRYHIYEADVETIQINGPLPDSPQDLGYVGQILVEVYAQ